MSDARAAARASPCLCGFHHPAFRTGRRRLRRLALVAIGLALGFHPVQQASPSERNWPHLRGAEYDGHAPGLKVDLPWPEAGPPVLWRVRLGTGYSGLVAVGGRAYTQAQTAAGQFVVALYVATGRVAWRSRYAWPFELGSSWPGPYATPTYSDGRIFFAGPGGIVGAMDAEDGRIVWTLDTRARFDGRGAGFGYAASPLVEEGRVFLPVGGVGASVVALDARDGSVLWATGNDAASYVPCYPITVDGHRQIVSILESVLVAHDPASGRELWRHELGDDYNPRTAWPIWQPPYLFAAFGLRQGARALALSYRGGEPRAEPAWSTTSFSNEVASSVLVDGFVYGFDIHDVQSDVRGGTKGELKCIELATGEERWSTAEVGNASLVTDGRHLILLDERGTLILAAATPIEYRELARAPIFQDRVSWTSPTPYGGRLLLRSREEVACVLLDGTEEAPATATAVPGQGLVDAWTVRHQDRSFWAPSLADLAWWFSGSLLFVLGLPALLASPLHRPLRWSVFATLAAAIGVLGMPILTEMAGRLVFTWPAVLLVFFWGVYRTALRAARDRARRSALRARAALLLFAALCVVYFLACGRLYLLAGWGFLAGLVPALPFTHVLARAMEARRPVGVLAAGLLAFCAFFWSSALAFAWKAGLL